MTADLPRSTAKNPFKWELLGTYPSVRQWLAKLGWVGPATEQATGRRIPRDTPALLSLLHATYHRQDGPIELRTIWIERADRPDLIEYVVALDDDDQVALGETEGHLRAVNAASPGRVTAVRNWNAAANVASGDVLIVIADDLFPPQGWDTLLRAAFKGLNPSRTSFAIKVTDDPRSDDALLRHPVVSRRYFECFGLFSEVFDGVYCDNDITLTAFWRAVILDGRSVVLEHRHPELRKDVEPSISHTRMNEELLFAKGRSALESRWSEQHRSARIHLASAKPGSSLSAGRMRVFATERRVHERLRFVVAMGLQRVKRGTRKMRSFFHYRH